MLLLEIADPRLVGVSITDVRVDRELAFANIYVSAIEGSERADEILAGMQHAKGYLRYELSHRIDLRTFPQLRFHWDATIERAERIDRIISELHDSSLDNSESIGIGEIDHDRSPTGSPDE